ncbi:MAG: hypothetical protein HGB35_01005 [Geobacteraceae bacterium]|nr:hypothetical protein [Geobacteraceae bacterium]
MTLVNPRQKLRGTRSQNDAQTLPNGVIVYCTDSLELAVHDGSLVGGRKLQLIPDPGVGRLLNGKFVVSVASNNLTVSVKTLAGADPTPQTPVTLRFPGATVQLTAALSVTAAAGTNWMGLGGSMFANKVADLFCYLGYNATDGITIGFSRIPYATTYAEFSTTATAETFCKISNIAHVAGTDPYVVIGRFAASLGASATYYWTDQSTGTRGLIQRPIFETESRDFVPTMTNFAIGSNGLNYSRYMISGRNMFYEVVLILGSSGQSVSGAISYTLPFTSAGNYISSGVAEFFDTSTGGVYPAIHKLMSASAASLFAMNASGTYTITSAPSGSIPFTWAAGDGLFIKNMIWI